MCKLPQCYKQRHQWEYQRKTLVELLVWIFAILLTTVNKIFTTMRAWRHQINCKYETAKVLFSQCIKDTMFLYRWTQKMAIRCAYKHLPNSWEVYLLLLNSRVPLSGNDVSRSRFPNFRCTMILKPLIRFRELSVLPLVWELDGVESSLVVK
jgi:hypothetical protein